MTSKTTTSHLEIDFQNCLKSRLGGSGLVKCLMEVTSCQWAMAFGYSRFCNHPSTKQFVNRSDEVEDQIPSLAASSFSGLTE